MHGGYNTSLAVYVGVEWSNDRYSKRCQMTPDGTVVRDAPELCTELVLIAGCG